MRVENLRNVLGRDESVYTTSFTTRGLPEVETISIEDSQKDVGICEPITAVLDADPGDLVDFSFVLDPPAPLEEKRSADGKTYTLTPTGCLSQSTEYSLRVERLLTIYDARGGLVNFSDDPVLMDNVMFTTKGAPGIAGFTPQGGGVLTSTKEFTLSFSEEMAPAGESAYPTIQPTLAGAWRWVDARTLRFTADAALPFDTRFTVAVAKGLKDVQNGFTTDSASFSFSTVGHVTVVGFSPRSGSSGVAATSSIRVSFDQPVDRASAEQRFSITPAVDGSFSWSGQTMVFSGALSKDTEYRAAMEAGVVSLIGLASEKAAATTFRTEESVTLLNIPVYYQQRPLSCEMASLKMALQFKAVGVSEQTLLDVLGADTSPRVNGVWGDPYETFVGDVDGEQNTTGYGVYAPPVTRVANVYRSAETVTLTANNVAANLAAGNPVIYWGLAGKTSRDSWVTPTGRTIDAWVGEHVRLIVGFTGPVANPTGFIINDPIHGRLRWSTAKIQADWSVFAGMGVVVY